MNNLRFPFTDSSFVKQNYSQAGQDLFVLGILDGVRCGTYLEIGAAYPEYTSNTFLLESHFNWTGVSLDISQKFVKEFNKTRKNKCILADAMTVDYVKLLGSSKKTFDYLSIDCEPPEHTYKALLHIPLDRYKFAVITYEHDAYIGGEKFRRLSREYLSSQGYELVVSNISDTTENRPFEDWWVHPELIPRDVIEELKSITDYFQYWKDYIFNE